MKIAFFHGLESSPKGGKYKYLVNKYTEVYAMPMNYDDPKLFDKTIKDLIQFKPDYLVGSSMGGWYALCISSITGIPTLTFNPAVHSRSIDPIVFRGNMRAKHIVVLGAKDRVIEPEQTKTWFEANYPKSDFTIITETNMEHRTPVSIFDRWIKKLK